MEPERPRLPSWLIPIVLAGASVAATAILAYGRINALEAQISEVKSERLKQIEARIDTAIYDVMPGITENRTRISDLEKQLDRYNNRLTRLEERR